MGQQNGAGEKALSDWRQQIDALDTELLRLLNQRAAIACEIAVVKVASDLPAYDGKREQQVLDRMAEKNAGPLDQQSVTAIFRSIIGETRRLGTQRMQKASEIPTLSFAEGEGSLHSSGTAVHQQLHSAKRKSFP